MTDDVKGSMEQLIQSSNNIAVIPSQVGGVDAFAASLGLYLALKDKDKDKKISFIYPNGILEGFEDLISNDEVVINPALRNLVVEIDYSKTPAEKVNYSTQNDILTLRISPVDSSFNLDDVRAGLEGMGYDLIFVIGAQSKEDLGIVYSALEEEFRTAKVVNIDNTAINTKFGDINVVDTRMENLSQLVMNFIVKSGFILGQRPAKALLKGISQRLVN